MNLFLTQLNRQQRRLYAGLEASRIGRGGTQVVSRITGLAPKTISRGRAQLTAGLDGEPIQPDPRSGGRPSTEERYPGIEGILEQILSDEVAGDPMSDQKWVRNSVEHISERLKEFGIEVTGMTVWRLLRRMGFSMKYSKKRRQGSGHHSPDRDQQFRYIASKRQQFAAAGLPIISVDTKKRELIGDFKNPGKTWCRQAPEVNEHDFPSAAECRAVPLGIYDLARNKGYVVVGISNATSEFAVKAIARWWQEEGRCRHPTSEEVLILADCGGTNGYRSKAWKQQLQQQLCDSLNLTVTVCHYPPGCSKWNPVERRLFSQISINWAGKPLRSLRILLGYIRGTTTSTGLTVEAHLDEATYRKGQKVSREEMDRLNLKRHEVCPEWNYTLSPRKGSVKG
jgi:hypothetical protein